MILASASPRRKELLEQAGFQLEIVPADVDESRRLHETPIAMVKRLAISKAQAVFDEHGLTSPHRVILAADTIVWTGDEVLGKPHDEEDARRMLRLLSNTTHHVSTGVCMLANDGEGIQRHSFVDTTSVTFLKLSDAQIDAYVATGEPMDKAGAYGIQGGAGTFVREINGDYHNVVGLPIDRVRQELASLLKEGLSL